MENQYSIEELIKTFNIHAEESKKLKNDLKEKYLENFPNEDLPSQFNNDFEIALALASICQEIENIKDWIYYHDL